jgi:excisionase family DNA binding protein
VGEDRTGRNLDRALTVAQAAEVLGVSQDAVRKRIRRGTIQSGRDESGRVYVYVPASETVHKTAQDTSGTQPDATALTSELRDRLRYVEGQLEAERLAHAEARRLLMAALERIPPQLEASEAPEARESPETRSDADPNTQAPPEPETPAEPRPWWRRWFGA